jgi:hypothetical protein
MAITRCLTSSTNSSSILPDCSLVLQSLGECGNKMQSSIAGAQQDGSTVRAAM